MSKNLVYFISLASLIVICAHAEPDGNAATLSTPHSELANTQKPNARAISLSSSPYLAKSQPQLPNNATKEVGALVDKHLMTLEKEIYTISKELEKLKEAKNTSDKDKVHGYYLHQHQVMPSFRTSNSTLLRVPIGESNYTSDSSRKSVNSQSEPLSSEILNQGAVTTPNFQQGSLISVPNMDQGKIPVSYLPENKSLIKLNKSKKSVSANSLQTSQYYLDEPLLNKSWVVLLFTASGIMVLLTFGVYYRQRQIDKIHKGSSEIIIKKIRN